MTTLHLCLNCYDTKAKPFPIGTDKGTQRDPYRDTVDLCDECIDALVNGRFDVLHRRYREERTMHREAHGG